MNRVENTRSKPPGGWVWFLFILVLLATLVPSLYALVLSFQEYKPLYGLANSPWVGTRQYEQFFQGAYAGRIVRNSAWLSTQGLLGALLLGIPFGWIASHIESDRGRRFAIASLLLPTFVPAFCYAATALTWLPKDWFTAPQQYPMAYLCMVALPGAGLVGFASALYAECMPGRGFWQGIGWVLLAAAFLCLTPDLETVHLTMNPMTYATSDIMDTYTYRQGLQQAVFSSASAVYTVKVLLQCMIGAVLVCAAMGLWRLVRRSAVDPAQAASKRTLPWALYAIPALLLWAGGLYLLLTSSHTMGEATGAWPEMRQIISTLLVTLATFAFSWAILALLANGLRRMNWAATCLCMVLLLATRNATIGEYFLARQWGFINTAFPTILFSFLSPVVMVLLLLISRMARHAHSDMSTLKAALLPACFAAAQAWGSSFKSMLFTTDMSKSSLGLWVRMGGAEGPQMLVLLLVPCLLLGMIGTWGALGALSKR